MTAAADREVHVVLPGGVHDAGSPSGGNVYDLRVCQELAREHGWHVRPTAVPGTWPQPSPAACAALDRALAAMPDGAVVLLDGLVACGVPGTVVPHASRLALAVLVHLPLADETGLPPALAADLTERERATLRAAAAVVVTSRWAAGRIAGHGLDAARVHVAEPGTDAAPLAPGTDGASGLLCVASVTPRKGQDLLVEALSQLGDRTVTCVLAGPLDRDPGYVARLRDRLDQLGMRGRVRLAGPLGGPDLEAAYRAADLVVLVSWTETYGMAVAEALARGIPVLASDAGALPDTLGLAPDGTRPGLLVPAGDVPALATALRRWLDEPDLRERLRRSAQYRRGILGGWEHTARHLHGVLEQLGRMPAPGTPVAP